jgi:glycosyltransferase involved in cell wall biosynthesis
MIGFKGNMQNQVKKILIVSDEGFKAGGIGTSTANLAVALARAGQDVVLVWPDADSVILDGVRQVSVNAKRFDVGKLGFVMLALPPVKTAMPINWIPDVVHIMRPTYLGIWAYRLAKKAKAVTVLAMHEIIEQLPDTTFTGRVLRGIARWWFRTTYNAVDISLTPARFVVNQAHKSLSLSQKPSYLSNALDLTAWRLVSSPENLAPLADKKLQICTVINFSPYKNPMMIPELWAELRQRGLHIQLELVGGGVLFNDVQQRIETLKLQDLIHLRGPKGRSEVAALIGASDAFLLTSLFELQPMVLIESKALGTPALVAKAPLSGAVDLIEDGVTGVLFDLDIEKAADTLEPYFRDPQKLRAMRPATYADAAQYDLAPVALAALAIYAKPKPSVH